jgi:glycosyltransferase involved in cell wall biosynthesis
MKYPRLALLIPAYNAARYLPRLLDSAANQTYAFDEAWVYDDCSTDDTAGIAMRYGVKVVHGDLNRGCSYGKNQLVASTACDWIHFHDADDELRPNFVERARVWMADGRFDVVLFAYEERDETTGRSLGVGTFDPAAVTADARAYTIRNQVSNFALYRRDALLKAGGYDEDPQVLFNEDVAFHIRLAFHGLSFAADETITVINHRRAASMSAANALKCLQAHYNVLHKTRILPGADHYANDIAYRLWVAVGGLAAHLDWRTADEAAMLAMALAGTSSAPAGQAFRVLCRLSPRLAIRTREWLIRVFKPALRTDYPGWRLAL